MSSSPRTPARHPQLIAAVGQRVRERRLDLGLTMRACADGSPFSFTWLSDVETGRINPTLSALIDLAAVLKTDVPTLLRDLMDD